MKGDKLIATFGANLRSSVGAPGAGAAGQGVTPPPAGPNPAAGLERVRNALLIPLDRLEPDPDQPRREFDPDALDRLAASLRERGQLVPAQVRWAGAAWALVAGERRWRAARLAGLDRLACVEVTGDAADAGVRRELQLIENCLREDLKPVEQARAFRDLMNARGLTQAQVAERLRVSQGSVSRALALLRLPEDVQEEVDAGGLAAREAYRIAATPDPEERAGAVERVRAAARQPRADRPRRLRATFPVPGARVAVTLDDPGGGPGAVVNALTAALRAARENARGAA